MSTATHTRAYETLKADPKIHAMVEVMVTADPQWQKFTEYELEAELCNPIWLVSIAKGMDDYEVEIPDDTTNGDVVDAFRDLIMEHA